MCAELAVCCRQAERYLVILPLTTRGWWLVPVLALSIVCFACFTLLCLLRLLCWLGLLIFLLVLLTWFGHFLASLPLHASFACLLIFLPSATQDRAAFSQRVREHIREVGKKKQRTKKPGTYFFLFSTAIGTTGNSDASGSAVPHRATA